MKINRFESFAIEIHAHNADNPSVEYELWLGENAEGDDVLIMDEFLSDDERSHMLRFCSVPCAYNYFVSYLERHDDKKLVIDAFCIVSELIKEV